MSRKLSIITINLNNAAGLSKTVNSVKGQAFSDFEYIVIDGGSSDGSLEIIGEFKDRIDYWISEKDNGVYHAMNKGIEKATGDYCYFLNSGDYLISDSVINNVFSKTNGEDIVYGNMIHGGLNTVERGPKDISFFYFYMGSIYHQSAFIKRKLFNEVGYYNESLKVVSDWEFFLKAFFLFGCSYKYVDVNIALYETGGLSFQNIDYNLKERKDVMLKLFPLFRKDYEELERFKMSDFAGIYKRMEKPSIFRAILKRSVALSRFIKFNIFRKSH
jgi:glycosyltransferase involved in cell wall biosynthesis